MSAPENPPAFPSVALDDPGHPASIPGMTLRDWFVSQAVGSVILNCVTDTRLPNETIEQLFARKAGRIADAMLVERRRINDGLPAEMRPVAYFDEGKFHWISGIAPRDCELFAKRSTTGDAA